MFYVLNCFKLYIIHVNILDC